MRWETTFCFEWCLHVLSVGGGRFGKEEDAHKGDDCADDGLDKAEGRIGDGTQFGIERGKNHNDDRGDGSNAPMLWDAEQLADEIGDGDSNRQADGTERENRKVKNRGDGADERTKDTLDAGLPCGLSGRLKDEDAGNCRPHAAGDGSSAVKEGGDGRPNHKGDETDQRVLEGVQDLDAVHGGKELERVCESGGGAGEQESSFAFIAG